MLTIYRFLACLGFPQSCGILDYLRSYSHCLLEKRVDEPGSMIGTPLEQVSLNCLLLHGCVWYVDQASLGTLPSLSRTILTNHNDYRNTLDSGDGILISPRVRHWVGKSQRRSKSPHYCRFLSQFLWCTSSYKAAVYNPRPQKVTITCCNAPYNHPSTRVLPPIPPTPQSAGGPNNMDEWRSMGELSHCGRLLGDNSLRRCYHQICGTDSGSGMCHPGHVLEAILSLVLEWVDKREVQRLESYTLRGQHEASEEPG